MYSLFARNAPLPERSLNSGIVIVSPSIAMKKEVILSVRVEPDIDEILRNLAKKDDRTVAWIVRKLLIEALEARRLLKAKPAK